MILDYNYNRSKRNLSVSYIKENGMKALLNFNVDRFKTYYLTPSGKYENWDGSKCGVKWVDKPHNFDIKTYLEEIPEEYKNLLKGKVAPKLYTFDIETEISDEFPEPSEAKFPITTISIANENCDVIILGTKKLDNEEYLIKSYEKYINQSSYCKSIGVTSPTIKYIHFLTEEKMLEYFLKNIVAKVPVLAGWNSIMFDWQYIQNRLRGYYPDLSLNCCSTNWTMTAKNYTDMKGNKVRLSMPNHTLILDMMDVVGSFDMVVLPIKESLSLDYIASESIGMNKIKYDGDLQKLYNEDYGTYVFYNAIDSVLVQLIDKRFKTLQNIYTQSLYCRERIGQCFSKIALTEALVFNDFYEHGIKIVPMDNYETERGTLVGAYVKQPIPGKHNFVCCNDFASLYPSTIITCNLSYENYLGCVGNEFTEEEAERLKKDKNFFVSVNGCIYKNDKDYSFKRIQATLKSNRNVGKYLAKQLYALVMTDVDHILKGQNPTNQVYPDNIQKALRDMLYIIEKTDDLKGLQIEALQEFKAKLENEITYYTSYEQAMKLLGNSMYGGSSHVAFFWFNMNLANDITGEARNLIHMMEEHIPNHFAENWKTMVDVHKMLNIKLKKNPVIPYVTICYGDTDSLYISYEGLLNSIEGIEKMSMEDKLKVIVNLNTKYLDQHNKKFIEDYYKTRFADSIHDFELETVALSGVWLDVKKRYAQILLWKDGKYYDMDSLPMKIKGLEMVKSSYPKQAREGLKRIVRYFLEDQSEDYLLQRLNIEVQKEKELWNKADIEDICENKGVRNYTKYILDDNSKFGLQIAPKCPYNVRALGNYNNIRNIYNLPGDPIYGGKLKIYQVVRKAKKADEEFFAFQSRNYPSWAEQYAPIDKNIMFKKFFLEPFNRILSAVGIGELNTDGSIQLGLF